MKNLKKQLLWLIRQLEKLILNLKKLEKWLGVLLLILMLPLSSYCQSNKYPRQSQISGVDVVIITLEQAELMNNNFTKLKTNVDSISKIKEDTDYRMDSLKVAFMNFKQDSTLVEIKQVKPYQQKLNISDNIVKVTIVAGALLTGYKMITTP